MQKERYVESVYEELSLRGYEVRLNHRRTHVQLKTCIFCGNPNWNLDIELSERFVYSCWDCQKGGKAAHLLQHLHLHTRVPLPSGELLIQPSKQTDLYFRYPNFPLLESDSKYRKIKHLKRIHPSKPVRFGGLVIKNGYMLLGLTGQGVLIADSDTKQVRRTRGDLFLFSSSFVFSTIAIVESFFDIFPFFTNTPTLVFGGTSLNRDLYTELQKLASPKQILLSLDDGAEKPALRRLKDVYPASKILTLKPEKHSPAESKFLFLHQID